MIMECITGKTEFTSSFPAASLILIQLKVRSLNDGQIKC